MWWPSPMDGTCWEVTEEGSGSAPSWKRHSAWGLEELARELSFEQLDDRDTADSNDAAKASPAAEADVTVDADVTSYVDLDGVFTSEELSQTEDDTSMFHLLNIYCST